MRGFGQFQAASFFKFQVTAGQLHFQFIGMKTGTEQDGDFIFRRSLFKQPINGIDHKAGLNRFTAAAEHLRSDSPFFLGIEGFGKFFFGLFDNGVGEAENGLSGTVVLFQLDDLGTVELIGKTHDIVKISAPETINGLGIITDHHHVPPGSGWYPDTRRQEYIENVRIFLLLQYRIRPAAAASSPAGHHNP